jgi:hypothetical protein
MFKLILGEIQYHWIIFFLLFPFTILIFLYERFDSEYNSMLIYFVALLLLSGVYSNRRRERRDRQLILLPVKTFEMGLVRISVLLLGIIITLLFYFLIQLGFGDMNNVEWTTSITLCCLLVSIYSIMFILVDLFPASVKRVKGIAIATLFGITLAGLGLTIYLGTSESEPGNALAIIRFFEDHYPFYGISGVMRLIALTLALSFISALTFKRRRSYT